MRRDLLHEIVRWHGKEPVTIKIAACRLIHRV